VSNLPATWCETTIDQLGRITTGNTPSKSDPRNFGTACPWVKPPDLNPQTPVTHTEEGLSEHGTAFARVLPAGAVLVCCIGSLGKVGLAGVPLATNQQINSVAFDDRSVEARYGFYYCQTLTNWLSKNASATTVSIVNKTTFSRAPFILAPREEQKRIVAEIEKQLTRLDAAVTALKRVQANLKRYRASVLKAACEGRLVPTEAELARRERRSYEPASVLIARILTDRRSRWEAAQLAKFKASGKMPTDSSWKAKYAQPAAPDINNAATMPEGWVQVSWNQIGFSQNGRLFPSSEYCDHGFKLLRPGNLYPNGAVGWTSSNTRHLPEKWASDFPEFVIGEEELVMNLTAQSLKDEFLGRACLTSTGERCLLNQRIARLKPVLIRPKYLLCVFKSQLFRRFVNGLNTGSLIQHMFTSQLNDFVLPLPPLEEQKRIVEEAEKRLSVIERIEIQTEADILRAEHLRQAILKNAFEGKLVPQDPNDEPASILLERIRGAATLSGTAIPGCAPPLKNKPRRKLAHRKSPIQVLSS
jgi:type I restriction enzyme S subunit